MTLKTDYKDEILQSEQTYRTYDIMKDSQVIQSDIHLVRKDRPLQEGDNYGAKDINELNATVNGLAPMNLLVNGDFQINQREKTEYTSGPNMYTVDMWRKGASVLNTTFHGIKINTTGNSGDGMFGQKVKEIHGAGEKYIVCVYVRSLQGNASINTAASFVQSYNSGYTLKPGLNTFAITTQGDWLILTMRPNTVIEIEYIDLFKGDVAYPHVKEDYAIALSRCQAHVYRVEISLYANRDSGNNAYTVGIPFPKKMINTPTIKILRAQNTNNTPLEPVSSHFSIRTGSINYLFFKNVLGNLIHVDVLATCEPL